MKKTVIITGSNSGIGFELAKKLISENYFVILACRNRNKGLDAEKKLGINSKFIEVDFEFIPSFFSASSPLFLFLHAKITK